MHHDICPASPGIEHQKHAPGVAGLAGLAAATAAALRRSVTIAMAAATAAAIDVVLKAYLNVGQAGDL